MSGKTVLVIGQSRCGTSITAGILRFLGVNTGRVSRIPDKANKKGYFENWNLMQFNIRLLEDNDFFINKIPLPRIKDVLKILLPLSPEHKKEIKRLLKEYKGNELWGWKDPRTLWIFELFQPFIENPHFIVCHRNIDSIAKSLKFRDGMNIEYGIELAKEYYQLVEEFFKKYHYPRLDVYYEDYFEGDEQVKKICEFLEIPFEKGKIESKNFIDLNLKHF